MADLTPKSLLTKNEALIALIGADDIEEDESIKVAHEIRNRGLKTESLLSGKMGKKMQKANKVGAHYALILGGNEVANKTVTVTNFATDEQAEITREALMTVEDALI